MSTLSAEERGDMVEALLPVATNLVTLVHGDGGPRDVHQALARLKSGEKDAMLVILAGLVDPDRSIGKALGWLDFSEDGQLVVPHWDENVSVRDLAEAQDGTEPEDEYVDPVAVDRFVAGAPVLVTDAEHLIAVRECVAQGMTYSGIDVLRRRSKGATERFVYRMRRTYQRSGREFPSLQSSGGAVCLTPEQVVEMRELYAAGGVTDLSLSLKYDVSRKTITNALSGVSYREVGGPIRAARGKKPGVESRVLFNGRTPGSVPAAIAGRSDVTEQMESAA